jgi:hypothetical protein
LLPRIKINTSSNDYFPVEQMQMSKFNGEYGELFGPVISGNQKGIAVVASADAFTGSRGLRRHRPQFALSAGAFENIDDGLGRLGGSLHRVLPSRSEMVTTLTARMSDLLAPISKSTTCT